MTKSVSVGFLLTIAMMDLVANQATAFTTPRSGASSICTSALSMAPKFDPTTQRWTPTTPSDTEDAYGPFETVVRNGPLPFIGRVLSEDNYEQGVYKMMVSDGMTRKEAQGNMDAYLENAGDWAYQKQQEQNGGPKKDYAKSPTQKQFALAGTWVAILFWFFGSILVDTVGGKYI